MSFDVDQFKTLRTRLFRILQNDRERPDVTASVHDQKQESKGSPEQQPFESAEGSQGHPLRAVNQGRQRGTVDQTCSTAHEFLHDAVLSVSTHEMALRRTANEKDFASQTFIVSEHAEITSDANLTHWQARETDLYVIRQDGPKSAQMPSIFDTENLMTIEDLLLSHHPVQQFSQNAISSEIGADSSDIGFLSTLSPRHLHPSCGAIFTNSD